MIAELLRKHGKLLGNVNTINMDQSNINFIPTIHPNHRICHLSFGNFLTTFRDAGAKVGQGGRRGRQGHSRPMTREPKIGWIWGPPPENFLLPRIF